MFAGIIDQHVQTALLLQDSLHNRLPRVRLGHIQFNDVTPPTAVPRRFLRLFSSIPNSQPDIIPRVLLQESFGNCLTQAPIGPSDEYRAAIHSWASVVLNRAAIACWLHPTTLTMASLWSLFEIAA
jgi:hypothetical protein